MRVLTVFHYPVFGGPQNRAVQLRAELLKAGVHTTAVVPEEGQAAAARMAASGLDVVRLPLHRLRAVPDVRVHASLVRGLVPEIRALRRVIRDVQADVVQVNGLVNPHAAVAARLEGCAVVWQLQDTRTPLVARQLILPLVLSLSDVVMTTGEAVLHAHPGLGLLRDRAVPHYPPVDTAVFRPRPEDRQAARAGLGVPGESMVVASLGNINRQKGHEYAVRAVGAGVAAGQDLVVRILGSHSPTQAEYERLLVAEARAQGLLCDGRFAVLGPERGIAEVLPGVDIGVLAALPHSEGVPTMILEAMACGIPVVATDVGGVREAVTNGSDGVIVTPLRDDEIRDALLWLSGDADLRARMGAAGRAAVLDRFTVRHSARVHLRCYELAVRRAQARRRRAASGRSSTDRGSDG